MSYNTLVTQVQELLNSQFSEEELERKQLALEESADGFERELREGKRLEDVFKRTTDDPMVQRIMSGVIDKMMEFFEEELGKTVRGVGAKYKNILRALDLEVLVGTVLAHSLDRLIHEDSVNSSIQRLGSAIGKGIVTEVKTAQAYDINPMYMDKVDEGLKRRRATNKNFIRSVYDSAFNVVTLGELEYDLNEADYIHIGKFGIEAMMYAGLIVLDKTFSNGREWSVYNLHPEIYEYILTFQPEIHKQSLSSMFRFMVCKPDDWKGLSGGGFKSPRRKLYNQLISFKGIDRDLYREYSTRFTAESMPLVFDFANFIQSVPYTISPEVVELISTIYQQGGGMLGVPDSNDPVEPTFPFSTEWDKDTASESELESFTQWKFLKSQWHEEVLQRRQKRREMQAFFQAVHEGVSKLYFVVFFDFRGRMYYHGNPNPQGSDLARACLHFHDKKPLGERGLFWLKVHLANSLGVDDCRFHLRVKYVDSIWHILEKAVEAPLSMPEAFGDEAPMTAYITALEIKRALDSDSPETYECGIPVHMDATVSGTQHFSAMLKDEVGAEYTNLIDMGGDKKADLYRQVAEVTIQVMCKEENPDKLEFALRWTQAGIPRSTAKKPVMTFTYGVTKRTIHDHIRGEAFATGIQNNPNYSAKSVGYCVDKLWDAIADTIPATVNGMKFLQDVARDVGNEAMSWYTPTGFWVYQNTKDVGRKRIAIRSAGVDLVWVRLVEDTTNRNKMVSGIAPNYVHSMDASHICLVGNGMREKGLSMACIHDSFGTHPCDVDEMHKIIRRTFINLYTEDVLDSFRQQVGSEVELPEYGSFDLSNVEDSEFFFC